MNNLNFAVVAIEGQKFGLPLTAIKAIESSDKVVTVDDQFSISALGSLFAVKSLIPNTSEQLKELVLVLSAEQELALFVDEFQSMQLSEDKVYTLPGIMQSEHSFVEKIYYERLSKEMIYLCQEDSFYNYLGEK